MRRVPVVPTAVVMLAVAAMVGLGLWQLLDRLPAKQAYLARLAANPSRPPIAFPRFPDDSLLFRRASGFCLQPTAIALAGAGASGFRAIAQCRTGAEGPGMIVQLGTTVDPARRVAWKGGPVSGTIGHAPSSAPLIAGLFHRQPQLLMLVADPPVDGLTANGRPDIDSVPNSHLAYAGQWFFFAAIAAIIYSLALVRRWRTRPEAPVVAAPAPPR
ncbi:SURF1 family cytochrome oxidase biogenesis protein [Sphingomonas bacterium]|uniref:SURF1 family cytochrome oxidase biogenesis protein n=1 Tax=Sphingomonas bacterium TaxID=1895847 RepID=UPI00157621EA|nr:SURF1 family cytochrome oxidase biogenesis protein [Sphingomonas bacterium]